MNIFEFGELLRLSCQFIGYKECNEVLKLRLVCKLWNSAILGGKIHLEYPVCIRTTRQLFKSREYFSKFNFKNVTYSWQDPKLLQLSCTEIATNLKWDQLFLRNVALSTESPSKIPIPGKLPQEKKLLQYPLKICGKSQNVVVMICNDIDPNIASEYEFKRYIIFRLEEWYNFKIYLYYDDNEKKTYFAIFINSEDKLLPINKRLRSTCPFRTKKQTLKDSNIRCDWCKIHPIDSCDICSYMIYLNSETHICQCKTCTRTKGDIPSVFLTKPTPKPDRKRARKG